MPKRGVIPTPDEARRIERVVRHVERTLPIRKARRQKRRRQTGASNASGQQGFPPGTGGCDCGAGVPGITMPASSTECCTGHLKWTFIDPVFGGEKSVLWTTGNVWISDVFTGPDCGGNANEYRWQLTVDIDGDTILELLIETDDGCDIACASYKSENGWQCQRHNEMALQPTWANCSPYCRTCLKPRGGSCERGFAGCSLPDCFTVTIPADLFLDGASSCNAVFEGTHTVSYNPSLSLAFSEIAVEEVCVYTFAPDAHSLIRLSFGGGGGDNLVLFTDGVGCTQGCVFQFQLDPVLWDCDGENELAFVTCGNVSDCPTETCISDYTDHELTITVEACGDPTSSGACATCTTGTTPADADAGACCADGTCFEFMSETDCGTLSGDWHESLAECETQCEGAGSCCQYLSATTYTCIDDITYMDCQGLIPSGTVVRGVVWEFGGDCVCDPIGACCDESDGTCTDYRLESECIGATEVWYSEQLCSEITCEASGTGACCWYNGFSCQCSTEDEATCLARSGNPQWFAAESCDGGNPPNPCSSVAPDCDHM